MTLLEIERRILDALDNPLPQHPTPSQRRGVLLRHGQHFRNIVRNSGEVQLIEWPTVNLELNPGQDEYLVNAPNYGTFVYGHRVDADNISEPPVEFVKLQNIAQYPETYLPTGKDFVPVISPLVTSSGIVFRIRPKVSEVMTLKLYYEPAQINFAMGEALEFAQHHHLIVAKCVTETLPLCHWWPLDVEKAMKDRGYRQDWDAYHKSKRVELSSPHLAFAADAQFYLQRDIQQLRKPVVVSASSGIDLCDPR